MKHLLGNTGIVNDNNELHAFANTAYRYDENGNATQLLLDSVVMFTYHYNAQDRLVKVEDVNGGTIAEYAYDPFGRRLWKDVGGSKTYFFYADEGLVAEYDVAGNETTSYGYKPNSTWTTDPLWMKVSLNGVEGGGEYYFYQNDHLGTPQKLVKQNGAVVWSASYTAFGQASIEVEAVVNYLRFPGQYFDAETGLHYNWVRYYETQVGRFLQPDLLREENFSYIYTENNPVIKFDPLGLKETCTWHTSKAGAGKPFGCALPLVVLHAIHLRDKACRLCWNIECPDKDFSLKYSHHGEPPNDREALRDEPGLSLEFKTPCLARPDSENQNDPIITGTPFPDEWQTRKPEKGFNVCIAVSSKTIRDDPGAANCISVKFQCCPKNCEN